MSRWLKGVVMLFAVSLVFQLSGGYAKAQDNTAETKPAEVKSPVSDEDIAKIKAAMPEKALVKPKRGRKMLVFSLCEGFKHDSIPYWVKALEIMGEKTGAFEVVNSTDMGIFNKKDLSQFDAVCFNNTTYLVPDESQQKAIMDFIKTGMGIVGIHAATDSFYEWPEGMMMMGGIFKGHPWTGDGTWAIKIDDPGHPLMKSFNGQGFKINDEIYRTLGPQYSRENQRVLMSLDMSDPVTKNAEGVIPEDMDTGISWVKPVGKGRLFYCSLGHVKAVTWNPAVLEHYLAGIQFALGDLEIDTTPLPNVSMFNDFEKAVSAISGYKYGQSRSGLNNINDLITAAHGSSSTLAKMEKTMIDFLKSDATIESKQFICEKLSLTGTKASVETLGAMLLQKDTSDMARMALEEIPDSSVEDLLRDSVGRTSGKMQAGIINTIGRRKDVKAVKMLGELIASSDQQVALAAIAALGNIANSEAKSILEKNLSGMTGQKQVIAYDSYLKCVENAAETDRSKAFRMYKDIYDSSASSIVRSDALRGMVLTADKDADKIIIKAIKQNDPEIRSMAILLVGQLQREDQLTAIAKELAGLEPAVQVQLLSVLAETGQTALAPQIMSLVDAKDRQVSIAAIRAIGRVGNESAVDELISIATSDDKEKREAAQESLYILKGQKVDQIILDAIANSEPKTKIELIKAVGERNITDGADVLLKGYKDEDAAIQTESIKALKVIAGPDKIKELINVLIMAKDATAQKEAQKTLAAVALKEPEPKGRAKFILSALRIVRAPEPRSLLIGVLGWIGDDSSLDVLYESLDSDNEKIKYAAVTSLSDWPNSKPAAKLWDAATKSADEKTRILATRGFVKVVGQDEGRYVEDVVAIFKQAMDLAADTSEKKKIISGLSKIKSTSALEMAASYLDDSQFQQEAQFAAVKIASAVAAQNPQLTKEVMNKIIAGADNGKVKDAAVKILNEISDIADYIVTWKLAGPYMIKGTGGEKLFDMTLAPEKGGSSIDWRDLVNKADAERPYIIDLGKVIGGDNRVAYTATKVYSPAAQKAVLEIGSDDGIKVWINDLLVHANNVIRPVIPGNDKAQVALKEGSNTLLIKSVQVAGNWGFCVRLRTTDGQAIEGLKVVAEIE